MIIDYPELRRLNGPRDSVLHGFFLRKPNTCLRNSKKGEIFFNLENKRIYNMDV